MDANEKSGCNGRDFQTAECRGGNCSIGKEGKPKRSYLMHIKFSFSRFAHTTVHQL